MLLDWWIKVPNLPFWWQGLDPASARESLLPDYIVPTVYFDDGAITVWESFSLFSLRHLVPIHGKLNTNTYCTVLNDSLLLYDSLLLSSMGWTRVSFKKTTTSVMFNRFIMDWYCGNEVNRVEWSVQSPVLNPIENLWGRLGPWRELPVLSKPNKNYIKSCHSRTCVVQVCLWKKQFQEKSNTNYYYNNYLTHSNKNYNDSNDN